MNASDRKRIRARYVETYGDAVNGSISWARLPEFLESNGFDCTSPWEIAAALGLRERYPMFDLLLELGF